MKTHPTRWVELHNDNTLHLIQGTKIGVDDNDDDIFSEVATTATVTLADSEDATWMKALLDLGYRPITDTVAFDGEKIRFEVSAI